MYRLSVEQMLHEFIVENNIATEEEIELVAKINGYKEESMLDIICCRTGNRTYAQCKMDGYEGTDELDHYYGLDEENEN